MWRSLGVFLLAGAAASTRGADVPEPNLPRPGSVVVIDVTGQVTATTGETARPLKADDRLRIGSTIATGRRSMVTLMLSNGATLQLGADAELEVEEFGQEAISSSLKVSELKAEPTISRTRLRLLRGDVSASVKPLQVAKGSSFWLMVPAGTLRVTEGSLRAMVRMHELGLGVFTLELERGTAAFETAGTTGFVNVPSGTKLAFALETENGVTKVGPMPKETTKTK